MSNAQENKPREFWIEQFNGRKPPSFYAFKDKPNFNKIILKDNSGNEFAGSEYFHVIEMSAYLAIQAENEKLKNELEALKEERDSIHDNAIGGWNAASAGQIEIEKLKEANKKLRDGLENLEGHALAHLQFPHKDISDFKCALHTARQILSEAEKIEGGE